MTLNRLKPLILVVAATGGNCQLQAQEFGLEYDTEWQTDFKGAYRWGNLLKLSAAVPVTKNLSFEATTISIAKTADEPLLADLQGYSNIEEENLPLTFATLGAELMTGRSSLFLGLRNVNEDYFTSPLTALLTNSSCGIYPTLSLNYDIANYPLTSWCMHYTLRLPQFKIQTSLYSGRGYKNIAGHDNIFRFSPGHDGMFSITSADYTNYDNHYTLGVAVHYGNRTFDEAGEPATSPNQAKRVACSPWASAEQRLTDRCSIMIQGSLTTGSEWCRQYFGAGVALDAGKVTLGIFGNYAGLSDGHEFAGELTARIALSPTVDLQPSLHLIRGSDVSGCVGLIRLHLSLPSGD